MEFQYYPGKVTSNNPLGYISLEKFIQVNKSPSNRLKDIFRKIREAETDGDEKLKAYLKQNNLYYFTPCVHIDKLRRYNNIICFTGLLVLDFDHIDNAVDFKEYLFLTYLFIMAAWLSPSRRGVKALVSIPIVITVDQFKEFYFGIANEMDQYKGFDGSGQNPVLPLFQSYDPDLLYRSDCTTWTEKGIKLDELKLNRVKTAPVKVEYSDYNRDRVVKVITKSVNKISDNGHPQLRSAAIVLGGYVASGYIDRSEAEQLINNLIEDNNYLKKGIPGYKKTAKWGINKGQVYPLYFKSSNTVSYG